MGSHCNSEQVMAWFERELNNPRNWFVPPLAKLEAVSALKRTYLAIGFLALLALYLCIGTYAELVCNAIGFFWPAYQTLKAAEIRSKEDDTKLLVYWVIFAFLSLVEFFSDAIANIFPPYFLIKLIFLLWLLLPMERNGVHIIYYKVIQPLFSRQFKFDEFCGSAVTSFSSAAQSTLEGARKLGKHN